jgi:hypothetical protein
MQRSYLKTPSQEAGEEFDENLTQAEASKRIKELQAKTGRGATSGRFPTEGIPECPLMCCA